MEIEEERPSGRYNISWATLSTWLLPGTRTFDVSNPTLQVAVETARAKGCDCFWVDDELPPQPSGPLPGDEDPDAYGPTAYDISQLVLPNQGLAACPAEGEAAAPAQ